MERSEKTKIKLMFLFVSSIITSIVIILYFIDDSFVWNIYKTASCIIIALWIFFILPAIRNSYLLNKDKSLDEWFKMGLSYGASGIIFSILLAPYYGVKYYLNL